MANVIPIRPSGETLSPAQIIDRLHALSRKLEHLKSETMDLDQLLNRVPPATKHSLLAGGATRDTITLLSTAVDAVLETVAELIVEVAVELIVPPLPANTQSG